MRHEAFFKAVTVDPGGYGGSWSDEMDLSEYELWECGVLEDAMSTKAADLLELSVAERIQIVEDIWDSIAAVPEAVALSKEQKKELDRRIEAYHLNPDAGCPWIEVRERIRNRSRS